MAPKRKRDNAPADPPMDSTSTRATRASTRSKKQKANNAPASKAAATPNPIVVEDEPEEITTVTKKQKKAKTDKKKSTKTVINILKNVDFREDDAGPSKPAGKPVVTKVAAPNHEAEPSKSSSTVKPPPPTPAKSRPLAKSYDSYDASRALTLFKKYADADDPNVIGPEGFTQLCADAQMPMDGALPLVLAWQLQAKEMGKLSKNEWVQAMGQLQISSLPQLSMAVKDLEDLLILDGQPLKRPKPPSHSLKKGDHDPYDRTNYWTYVDDTKAGFLKLYLFCFALAKPEEARNIDMETATAFWSVLLAPRYPIIGEVIEFINEKGTYKGANKDLWSMMYEFCQTVKPSLEDYEADGAWPTLLDDFASWKKSKMSNGQSNAGPAGGDSDE